MTMFRRLPPGLRITLALTLLSFFFAATGAAAADCFAVDSNGMPRECTLTEELGQCGADAYDSWVQCVDTDSDGYIDVKFLDRQVCNALAAVDLMACAFEVPWEAIKA